jgi:large subunit ribosomal protein L13
MGTYTAKMEDVERFWYIVNAENKVLGKLAAEVASILRGKHKPIFTPHVDAGDFIVVVNAEKVHLTGRKLDKKLYFSHSGYPGGLKVKSAGKMLKEKPEEVIRHAVRGMLPKNRLGRRLITKLKIYTGPDHPHQAQNPKELKIN